MKQTNEQNVVKLNNYRTDNGYSALSEIESYWEALRGSPLVPKRSEIDTRGIEHTLEYNFVLERIAIGMARFRIADSHLWNIMGMEVRGIPLSSFIAQSGRETFAVFWRTFSNAPRPVSLRWWQRSVVKVSGGSTNGDVAVSQ